MGVIVKRFGAKRGPRDGRERKLLSTAVCEPLDDFSQFSTLLYGEKKIGKTSLCAQFDDATFIFTEPGYRGLSLRKNLAEDWRDIRDYVEQLEEDDQRRDPQHKMVVVDIIDYAYDLCFTFMCQKLGIVHPHDENDYGKSWGAIRKEFEAVVKRLLSLQKGVIFVSHAKWQNIKRRDGTAHDKLMPTLSGQPMEVISGLVDNIFYFGYDGDERVLVINGDENLEAGTRIEDHFVTKQKRSKINTINMGSSPKIAYKNLMDAFNNELGKVGDVPAVHKPQPKKKGSRP